MSEGIRAEFQGVVTSHFKSGIRVQPDGSKNWATIWTGERPAEGTHVTVAGTITSKAEESRKEPGKWFGVSHINNATITTTAPAAPAEDPWGTDAGIFTGQEPF